MDTFVKLCKCGCGFPAPISTVNHASKGYVKGQPKRFKQGHRLGTPLLDRFYRHVNKNGKMPDKSAIVVHPEIAGLQCWEWTASKDRKGYGIFRMKRRNRPAHRVMRFIVTGRWPEPYGMHKCDNPSCVRFEHLFEGTEKENTQDMLRKGRNRNGNNLLTDSQVSEIKRLISSSSLFMKQIARSYGVKSKVIYDIGSGRCYKNV
jgi:hypothetical protein